MKDTAFYRGSRFAHVPKWKPIKNTSLALFREYHRLHDRCSFYLPEDAIEERERVSRQMDDIYAELRRRNFFTVPPTTPKAQYKAKNRKNRAKSQSDRTTKNCTLGVGKTNSDCSQHFAGGWYYTKDGLLRMAVPPHMGVDAEQACPKCRGWLTYPKNFSHWRWEVQYA